MTEWNHWLTVADGLKAAEETGILSKCTCGPQGAPSGAGAMCGHCRLEAAQKALSKLRMHSLAQNKMVEVLQGRALFRLRARRQLSQTYVSAVEEALDRCHRVEETLKQLTNALSVEPRWERSDWQEERTAAMLKDADLDGEGGPWDRDDDGAWETEPLIG